MKTNLKGPSDYAAFGLLLVVMAIVTWIVVGWVATWVGSLMSLLLP